MWNIRKDVRWESSRWTKEMNMTVTNSMLIDRFDEWEKSQTYGEITSPFARNFSCLGILNKPKPINRAPPNKFPRVLEARNPRICFPDIAAPLNLAQERKNMLAKTCSKSQMTYVEIGNQIPMAFPVIPLFSLLMKIARQIRQPPPVPRRNVCKKL